MAVVTLRPKPVAQVFRLLGALIAMLILMAIGLGVARWRAAEGGSPYGALSAVAPSSTSGPAPASLRTADATPDPAVPVETKPQASVAIATPAADPVPGSVLAPASDPARAQPRMIALGKSDVGQTQIVPAVVAAAAADAASKASAAVPPAARPQAAGKIVADASAKPEEDAPAGVININTASAEDMNHIPGAGRIGKTIVRHRPYASVQDLVDHRVLRASEFARIRSKITVN